MPEQRVSDERLAAFVRNTHERTIVDDMADDLRDARARLAALEPVARAAVALHALDNSDRCGADFDREYGVAYYGLADAVDALPEALRKELAGPPIDWDAPAEPRRPQLFHDDGATTPEDA